MLLDIIITGVSVSTVDCGYALPSVEQITSIPSVLSVHLPTLLFWR